MEKHSRDKLLETYKKEVLSKHEETINSIKGFRNKFEYLSATKFDLLAKQKAYAEMKEMVDRFYPGQEGVANLINEVCVPYALQWFDEQMRKYASPAVPARTLFAGDKEYGLYLNMLMDLDEIAGYGGSAQRRARILETYYGFSWEDAFNRICQPYLGMVVDIVNYQIDYSYIERNFVSIQQLQQFLEVAKEEGRESLIELLEKKLY